MRDQTREEALVPKPEILETAECWRLLAEVGVGRLGIVVDGHPDVFPVNFMVEKETVVFRTGDGTKLHAIEGGGNVALEADSVSAEFGLAWSVIVKGTAAVVERSDAVLTRIGRSLFPWQGTGQDHIIRISPESVTGRRFEATAHMLSRSPLDVATRAGLE
ncbi:pyridoxamine 5'-phosphate oxidase family protein [Paenarthrobacter sp. Z7-10]|uniref:pyridoxamine 5'-phosphate oxidase family protein n=1 Tax=Paenarthrobacter sp. Z7-10 TaxID=2787635 RepID=UPI0022A9245D|nr:pyridoxamine 5'-phosphate oxidase family protein [Paenarthrobacter sp. Z7-10]MCZ2402029.1 pyridoxamine 5'-phosphate oxidase family protein [Paenarthrobacter sp. Z7-10]